MSIRSLWIGTIAAVAAFGAVSSANAVIIDIVPGGTANVNAVDVVRKDTGFNLPGLFSEMYSFNNLIGVDTSLVFRINTTFPAGGPPGIANLQFEFMNGAIVQTFSNITNANGDLNPIPFVLNASFLSAGTTVLTVTGNSTGNGGSYDFEASVVPLPPALLLFGTALGGMGWLSRRRKASATA